MKGSWLTLVILAGGCAHLPQIAGSAEKTEAFLVSGSEDRRVLLGYLPLKNSPVGKGVNVFTLETSKVGYIPLRATFMFPSSLKAHESIVLNLKKLDNNWFKSSIEKTYINEFDLVVRRFLELQEKIMLRRETDAARIIEELGTVYDGFAAYHSLVGAFHWNNNRLDEAKKSYQSVLRLVPDSAEALGIIKAIDIMLGAR